MRRAARRLFVIGSAALLPICVAACALWVRSFLRSDVISRELGSDVEVSSWSLRSERGRVGFETFVWIGDDPPAAHRPEWTSEPLPINPTWPTHLLAVERDHAIDFRGVYALGAVWETMSRWPEPPQSFAPLRVVVPYWMIVLPLLIPAARLVAIARRARRGVCNICGYDLRATPERCPECGTAAT